jgi:hypothetical protein
MLYVKNLDVGDRFRVASAEQRSVNNRPMPRVLVFEIIKVYPQAPYYVVSTTPTLPGVFTLPPGAVVRGVEEPAPSPREIERFLGQVVRAKVVGYRLLWDGLTPLTSASPAAVGVLKMLRALNYDDFTREEAMSLCKTHLPKFYKHSQAVNFANCFTAVAQDLVARGLMEEILDSSKVPKKLREAYLVRQGRDG